MPDQECENLPECNKRFTNIEGHLTVTVKNGKERKMRLDEAVSDIWEDIQVIRDINLIWKVVKRYKYAFGSGGLLWVFHQYLIDLIKYLVQQ